MEARVKFPRGVQRLELSLLSHRAARRVRRKL
jgi:hypothetical protein